MKKHYTALIANKNNKLKLIYKKLSLNKIPIIKMNQTHSNHIHTITTYPTQPLTTITNTDGLITNLNNVALAVKFADCMPIIIQAHNYLCVLHSGRKGTQKQILTKAIKQLKTITQKNTHFHIWLGPHICNICYEIHPIKKLKFDMLTKTINQLKSEINLHHNKLTIHTECTHTSNHFYSYRGDNYTKKRNYIICYQHKHRL
tara:strand:- start:1615 stop:2220 length:606 start_codon:yes stop_codon:yes gene_type:complete